MEKIIIIGHGSPKKSANTIQTVCDLVHASIHPSCPGTCVTAAYLEFGEPSIMGAVEQCVAEGATRIVVHPYFLAAGIHVTKDIPETLNEAKAKFPQVQIVYTEPLGIHEKLIEIVRERIGHSARLKPSEIEPGSFALINQELDLDTIPAEHRPVVQRVIHATADFEYADTMRFHPDAISAGIGVVRTGRNILTDVEMVRTGINKKALERFGSSVLCRIPASGDGHSRSGAKTRAEIGIEEAFSDPANKIGIIAIGNAPTALLKTIELLNAQSASGNQQSPILVVGFPVGFVKALESKIQLANQSFPFITNLSRKGGSPVAAAIVNAIIRMAEGGDTINT
ncbi:MAG TPA: precorrin-8X methylmutase [Dissulfurispiraceae bacterium]|nr:precorrin-8X methylmutase [Dissulfurispiraceae bacterium]